VSKSKSKQERVSLDSGGPVVSVRFIVAIVMMVLGVAWIAFYYLAVRVDPGSGAEAGSPAFLADLGDWNYLIGFGLLMLGLGVSAHPDTPLGRGRGVVAGMLFCFLVGLLWICTYYVISDDVSRVPVMNDLGQFNLVVGISFMAVGFTFATRWE
jgi:hypothetical protein